MALSREFVSFPKSGRTWLRYALSLAGAADLIRFHHDGFEYNDGSKPALDFDFNARWQRSLAADRTVYLHRDPRDVMVSLYYQVTGRFKDFFHYRGTLSEFIRDDYFGARNLAEFQRQWTEIAACGQALRISYEDCHANFELVLSQLLAFYEIAVPDVSMSSIVRDSSFQKMKEVEASLTFGEPWLRKRNGAPKVRRGEVGGYRHELGSADVEYLNSVFRI